MLATLAELVAGSVQAEALTADLLDARQRLVSTREEERRRLRRDLHDGLGPLLTGLGLNLDAAQSNLTRDPDRAARYLGNAKEASSQVIGSLRELVYALRPPALDDLGFVGALRLQSDRIARDSGLTVDLRVPDELTLPAAVEVAALRTVVEAVTNVVRHSTARTVSIAIEHNEGDLTLAVTDDGKATSPWRAGVGLTGMRERAEEPAAPPSRTHAGRWVRPRDLPDDGCAPMTTVVLADNHPLVRQGLRAVFESTDDIQVVAEADNGLDAVRLCVEHRPDVVLMDLQLPGLHGIEATRRVRTGSPETVVLVLTMFEDDDTVFAAVAAGAAGYLLKGSAGADIVAARYVPRRLARRCSAPR